MKSYIPFMKRMESAGLQVLWNDQTEEYDVWRRDSSLPGFYLIVSLPARVVRRDYEQAVEIVSTSLELLKVFG